MKVVVKSQKKLAKPSTFGTSNFTPPISLMKEEKAYAKGQYTTIKCKTNQADANSPTREIQIPYFKTGTPEEFLDFWAKVKEVIMGQNMDPPAQFGLVRSLLKGDALTVWENRKFFHGAETEENFLQTYKDLSAHVFPKRALQVQKRYLRRFIRKPHDMPFRRFAARVNELNEQLKMFPNGVLDDNGDAQGFADTQKLADEELLDILEFGLPHYWQKGLIELNIDLLQGTPQQGMRELAAYCERKELTESNQTPRRRISILPTGREASNRSNETSRSANQAIRVKNIVPTMDEATTMETRANACSQVRKRCAQMRITRHTRRSVRTQSRRKTNCVLWWLK